MILPLGDAPNPKGAAVATYALIAVNCAVFLLVTVPLGVVRPDPRDPLFTEYIQTMARALPSGVPLEELIARATQYDLFVFEHGYRPAAPSLAALFTSMFLHGGFMHLFGNMLFLWIYGDNVEHRLGRAAYLFWYLATGASATVVHSVFSAGSEIPVVGASGAISGVLGFYFVWFPYNRVRLWVFLFPFFMNVFLVPARIVLGMYLIVDNLLPFLIVSGTGSSGAGVAYGAHIGGFVAGLVAAWLIARREVTAVPDDYRAARASTPAAPRTAAEEIEAALDRGDGERAAQLYFSLPAEQTRRLLEPRRSLELSRWLAEHGHGRAALVGYQRHLRDYPTGPGLAEAHLGAGLTQLHLLNQPAAAYQHLVEALSHDPDPITAATARQALAEIARRQKLQVRDGATR